MQNFIKSCDVYPKTLDDFKEKTFSGAAVSVVSIATIISLICVEIHWYHQVDRIHNLNVDVETGGRIPVNLDITFPHVACDVLSLDTMNGFGESQTDVDHDIVKTRLDLEGNILSSRKETELGENKDYSAKVKEAIKKASAKDYCGDCYGAADGPKDCCNTCESVREHYARKSWAFNLGPTIEQCIREKVERQARAVAEEGCNIRGHLKINKVQGNFHFAPGRSFSQNGAHIHDFLPFELEHFNVSHQINRLSFGADYPGLINPLDGQTRIVIDGPSGLYQYFIKVVPTTYQPLTGPTLLTNQYSVTEHVKPRVDVSGMGMGGGSIPGVFFMYDLSPIMVNVQETQRHRSFLHFITNLCSIVGGVFTVAGLVDRFFYFASQNLSSSGKGLS